MKTKVERGYHHNVRSDNGCTVTQIKPNGQTIVDEIPAGETTAVFAFTSEFDVSDDTAAVQQVFKLAPYQKLRLLGVVGGDKLPAGYTSLGYLECTGSQYMLFDLKLAECGVYVQITPTRPDKVNNFVFSWQTNYGGANGTSYRNFRWGASSSYVGWWDAGSITPGINTFGVKTEVSANFKNNKKLKLTANGESYEKALGAVTYCPFEKACWGKIIAWNKNGDMVLDASAYMRMHHIAMSEGSALKYDLLPALDSAGTPCMFDLVTKKAVYNEGTGAFIAGVENQGQLDAMLRKLPDRTGQEVGTLQVRLAEALQTPENEAKLDAMLAKNWEISQAA